MQQMSSILLGNSGKTTNSQVSGTVQLDDKQSFLSVFNQASQVDVDKTNLSLNTNEQPASIDAPSAEGSDVDLIFAQIDLAENFDTQADIEKSGKDLPLESELSELALSQADSELVLTEETQHSVEKGLLVNELAVDVFPEEAEIEELDKELDKELGNEISTTSFLSSLNTEQLDALTQFSSMSEQDLTALSVAELNKLINGYNQQVSITDNQALPLLIDGKLNNQTATIPVTEANADLITAEKAKLANSTSNIANSVQSAANATDTANNIAASAQVANAEKVVADSKVIADTNKLAKNEDKESVPVNLSKAEISVALDKPTSKVAFNNAMVNAVANSSQSTLAELGQESETIDVKALQNQSSFTPQHKSDVPQFQLSLRQGAESVVQMQDMIQKFAPVMKQQLITMVGQGVQHAEIRLDPAELGHMVVKVQVNGEQTQVQFQVAQSQTKDLIEQAIPKLREMLAEEGLQLADSQVSQDGESQKKSEYDEQNSSGENMLDEISAQELEIATKHAKSSNSAIDYYA
ncbi:flagellar hook-length control protein FliK [Shewanella sp. 1_MG-2023]|uniref:flagellar hook-length control protein FliK n=1 Tax=unclassified Shewanella TaxID=196818 RepID=UPI0026E1C16A|nr:MULTISPECIES: flagellar hook-length control protein FliK [unclassified Shewanella]MDO6612489.1 flagellar hook-length control protein FliK [Shewanella sp. 7_MG-2023]MDO6772470.1 flagellar hook-length control protein FliK [Shewanella sp. 2_MG-2023]MDO6794532.1 flagellar hook-length control protein FliK [Shewanella sp. 1_MG-2023]